MPTGFSWSELGVDSARVQGVKDAPLRSGRDFVLATLDAHRGDTREHLYTREELDAARTGDCLWNASQRELRERGRIHNDLRMLWGKRGAAHELRAHGGKIQPGPLPGPVGPPRGRAGAGAARAPRAEPLTRLLTSARQAATRRFPFRPTVTKPFRAIQTEIRSHVWAR